MDPALLLLVAFLVLLALFFFRVGFVSRTFRYRYSTQAAFAFLAVVLVPLCLLVLADQRRAAARLAALGIVPHPSVRHAVGVACGTTSGPIPWLMRSWGTRDPTWVFDVTASPEEILAFYRHETSAPGWSLVEDASPAMLVLRRGTQTLAISARETWTSRRIVYLLRQSPGAR